MDVLSAERRRWPRGVAAVVAALLPALVVLSFDALEGAMGRIGLDGGPVVLFLIVGLFMATFALSVIILAIGARAPAKEGLWAGAIVALTMLPTIAANIREYGWFVLVLWALFGGLAVGLGSVAGVLAQRLRGGAGTRPPAWVAIAAGGMVFLAALPFLPGPGYGLVIVVAVVALLVGVGLWALRHPSTD